jgi:hypothetical protein
MERLTGNELTALVQRVFMVRPEDTGLAIIVDLPDQTVADHERWRVRRDLAAGWFEELAPLSEAVLGIPTHLYVYRNVRHNNADLPATAWRHAGGALPSDADALLPADALPFDEIFSTHSLVIAPTQFSATAPLKLAARRLDFRAATMPGFTPAMIPALRLDYTQISARCAFLKEILDRAEGADIHFSVDGRDDHHLHLDLRFRPAHASGGLFPDNGVAGNLPSGETYIVPYEGEQPGIPSGTQGTLPVQFAQEVVVYQVRENVAGTVLGDGPIAERERGLLRAEPAYGNLAELGLGVLADFGLAPSGEILLDEKLGLHIAFGRSDHFGGQVGAAQFSCAEAVVHIDRVYLPATQPRIRVVSLVVHFPDGASQTLMAQDQFSVQFP